MKDEYKPPLFALGFITVVLTMSLAFYGALSLLNHWLKTL